MQYLHHENRLSTAALLEHSLPDDGSLRTRDDSMRVLVVDDDPISRQLVCNLVESLNANPISCDGGQMAIDALADDHFDLVLIDLSMPVIDGYEAIVRIRRNVGVWELPIIVITSHCERDDVLRAFRVGANDYITKPLDSEIASARIGVQLEVKRMQRALRDSEQRYSLTATGSNDGLWDWDLSNGVVYFSPRWQSILGIGDRAFSGTPQHWLSRIHPDDVERVHAALRRHLTECNVPFETELRMRHCDGSFRWMFCRGQSVVDPHGNPLRIAGSLTDSSVGRSIDALTGLPNRAFFMHRLSSRFENQQFSTSPNFAVLFIDLDNFKQVNDEYGHAAGDELLVRVARAIESTTRRGDSLVARLGGDEFA
jgi:PAS domain S-box-containing protein